MKLPRIYADDSGASHWEDVAFDLTSVDYAPPAPAVELSARGDAAGWVIIQVPKGWDGPRHRSPRRQLCIVTAGSAEVETSDGEQKSSGPGQAFLMEDVTGEGHSTRNADGGPSSVIMIQFE